MLHVRIDYYDTKLKANQTQFDYDFPSEEEVIQNVLAPYLRGELFLFAGIRMDAHDIRRVSVFYTNNTIQYMAEAAQANLNPHIIYTYTPEAVLKETEYSKDITRDIMQKAEALVGGLKQDEAPENKRIVEKTPLLFISHSSENEDIATALVEMLRTIGFTNKNLFCSSVPGFDIKEGEDIYDCLRSKFEQHDVFVIFLLSEQYYGSPACLNEMGAAWALRTQYSTFVLPGFEIPNIKGAINPRQMAIDLKDAKRVRGKISQLKDRLIDYFHLPETEDDTIWEEDRNKFIERVTDKG